MKKQMKYAKELLMGDKILLPEGELEVKRIMGGGSRIVVNYHYYFFPDQLVAVVSK